MLCIANGTILNGTCTEQLINTDECVEKHTSCQSPNGCSTVQAVILLSIFVQFKQTQEAIR